MLRLLVPRRQSKLFIAFFPDSPSSAHNAPWGRAHLRDVAGSAGEATTMKAMVLRIPSGLAVSCHKTPQRAGWLDRLRDMLRNLEHRWSLTLDAPFDADLGRFERNRSNSMTTPALRGLGCVHKDFKNSMMASCSSLFSFSNCLVT